MTDATTQSRVVDQPQPGFFLVRLVKGGPRVPARIMLDENGIWRADIDGVRQEPGASDPYRAAGVLRIWHSGQICTQAEYHYRLSLKKWAEAAAPEHPAMHPEKPIRLTAIPPLF